MDGKNSTYYGRKKVSGEDSHTTQNGTSHLDHLFDNNNNYLNNENLNNIKKSNGSLSGSFKSPDMNYSYDRYNSSSFESSGRSPDIYTSKQNNESSSTNHSYNNSPFSTITKSSITTPSYNISPPPNYHDYNSIRSNKTYNSISPTNSLLSNNDTNNYLDECHKNLIIKMNKLQNFKKSLIMQQKSALKDAENAKIKISDAAEQLHKIVEEDKEKLLKETTLYSENTSQELEKIGVQVEETLKASEELRKFLEDLQASNPPEEISNHRDSINSMMRNLDKVNQAVTVGALKFKVSDVAKTNMIGKVSVSDLDSSDPYIEEPVKVGLIEGSQMVAGITASNGKIYIIRELLPNVEIYNANLSRHKMLKLEGLRKPSDIAADSVSTHVYISDASGCIFKLNPETNVLKKLAIEVSGDPQGLYVIPSGAQNAGNILITCSDSKQAKEFTNQGEFVRAIKFQQDVANPWHCVSMGEGGWSGKVQSERRFVISHGYESGKPHRICHVNDKGITLNFFGKSNGSGNMKLDIPNRIALDKFGYVFVADRNNDRVVLLSPNLVYVRDIINKFQKIKQPKRIFLDQENGWLLVGLVNGNVHIFQLCDSVPDKNGNGFDNHVG